MPAPERGRDYSRILEQTWVWSVVGYTVLRFAIAWSAFSGHGVNVWIFGLLDVGTAWPYAKAVAAICKRASEGRWNALIAPTSLAMVTFFLPYAYLWFAAGSMPAGLRIGLAIMVTVLFVAATVGVLLKSRKLRRQAAPADAVIIDMRSGEAVIVAADQP